MLGRYATGHPSGAIQNNINTIIGAISNGGNGGLAFDRWYNGFYDRTWMYMNQNGNVGIGTTAPSDLLTLSGTTATLVNLNGATTNYRGLKMSNTS
jgi:hypothetical protein